MKTFSVEHQQQAMEGLEQQVGGLIHLYGFCQQPHTVAKLLATRLDELHGGQILIRTSDGQESWETWHWTVPMDERQEAHAAHFGAQIDAINPMPWLRNRKDATP